MASRIINIAACAWLVATIAYAVIADVPLW